MERILDERNEFCSCEYNSRHQMGLGTSWQNGRSSLLWLRSFLAVFKPHGSPPATDHHHGSWVPTTRGEGRSHLKVEHSHRSLKSREEYLEYRASKERF